LSQLASWTLEETPSLVHQHLDREIPDSPQGQQDRQPRRSGRLHQQPLEVHQQGSKLRSVATFVTGAYPGVKLPAIYKS